MSLDAVLDSMAAYTKLKLTELRTSEMAGGRIMLEETQRRSFPLPAAYFACTGTRDGKMIAGKFRTRGLFLLVLIVKSNVAGQPVPQDRAHGIARFAGRALKMVAAAKTWGNAEVEGVPEKVASTTPYSAAIDKHGVALWAITWEQQLVLSDDEVPVPLDDFLLLNAEYQIVPSNPEIDAEDEVHLEGAP
jgi:hypothetical protein